VIRLFEGWEEGCLHLDIRMRGSEDLDRLLACLRLQDESGKSRGAVASESKA
jgi:hypothetical protein